MKPLNVETHLYREQYKILLNANFYRHIYILKTMKLSKYGLTQK